MNKNISAAVLGLGISLGATSVAFAHEPAKVEAPASAAKANVTKPHHKHHHKVNHKHAHKHAKKASSL